MLIERLPDEIHVTLKDHAALNKPGLRLAYRPEQKIRPVNVVYEIDGKHILAEHMANSWVKASASEWKERKEKDEFDNEVVDSVPTLVHSKIAIYGEIEQMAKKPGEDHVVNRLSDRELQKVISKLQEYGIHRYRIF